MTEEDNDILDAALFRLWIRYASGSPGRVASAIAKCLSANDYRQALIALAKEDRINLPYPPEVKP